MSTAILVPDAPDYTAFPDIGRRNIFHTHLEVPLVLALLDVPRGRRVLEIGCGRGHALGVLARMLRPSRLMGVDVDPEALAEADARLRAAGREATLLRADVRHLPLPDASVDVVVDFGTCYHIADAERGLSEIARVLAPGGTLVHETRGSQLLAHPVRALGRRVPWEAAPALVVRRWGVLWTARTKAAADSVA